MARRIQQIVVLDEPPSADELGLVVRNIGSGTSGDVTIVGVERSNSGTPAGKIVSTVAVLILANNANSKNRGITNNGSSNIYLGSDNTVTTSGPTMGLKLVPNGSYTDSGIDSYVNEIWAIGDAVSLVENVSAWDRQ